MKKYRANHHRITHHARNQWGNDVYELRVNDKLEPILVELEVLTLEDDPYPTGSYWEVEFSSEYEGKGETTHVHMPAKFGDLPRDEFAQLLIDRALHNILLGVSD